MPLNAILLFVASLSWASGYLFIGMADAALPPVTVTAGQTAMGALAVLPAALTGTTAPILTFLIAVFVTRQTPYAPVRLAGVAVAFAGMLVFVGFDDLGAEESELSAMLTMMAGGAVFALNGILASLKARDLDPVALTFWVLLFGALGLGVAAGIADGPRLAWPGLAALGSLAAAGAIGTGVGFVAYYLLIERAGPTFAASYAYLVPPLGLGCGALVQGDTVTMAHLGGVALTLAGLWLLSRPVVRDRTDPGVRQA